MLINTTKSVSSAFHLNNHQSVKTLNIRVDGNTLPAERNPKYLDVTLDRQLTYRRHLEGSANKIAKRNCLIRKLAGTSWGAPTTVLRTSALALCYSVADYCAPVWARSSHTHLVDTKLRDSMRTITGCLKSTPVQWLPVMSGIPPPHLRRQEANQRSLEKLDNAPDNNPLKEICNSAPYSARLKLRKPYYKSRSENFAIIESWKREWADNAPRGGHLITDPTIKTNGFDSKRKYWTTRNRLLTGHARTGHTMHKWKLRNSPTCPRCQNSPETTDHIVLHCPFTKLDGGYETVLKCDDSFKDWVEKHDLEM